MYQIEDNFHMSNPVLNLDGALPLAVQNTNCYVSFIKFERIRKLLENN